MITNIFTGGGDGGFRFLFKKKKEKSLHENKREINKYLILLNV